MRKILLIFISLVLFTSLSYAEIPHLINYQGKLTDSSGVPLNGSYDITFRIYDEAGILLWEEPHTQAKGVPVTITKGIFSIMLGSVTLLNLAFDKPYFLGIQVGGDAEMTPRQQITSVGYAIRAIMAEDADKVDGKHASDLIQVGTATGGDLSGSYPNPKIAEGVISQSKFKTATGEVSGSGGNFILPGGSYGFYPQIKTQPSTYPTYIDVWIAYWANLDSGYVTMIGMSGYFEFGLGYAQQRYITSSGQDHWLFLLVDKETGEINSAYSAPDHPAYGNGGDFNKIHHPFGSSYDKTKYEIVLVDNETIVELKAQVTEEKSLLTLVNEFYKPNMTKEEAYKPLHSGKFLIEDKNGKQVQVKQIVETLPDYIKVRKLIRLTTQEKIDRENKRQQIIQEAKQQELKRKQNKDKAIQKLKELGLNEDEIDALIKQ